MVKAPFRLPEGWLTAFGYRHGRRFVALYWEPCGDEACFNDGEYYACGMADNWFFLRFIRQPEVRQWLVGNELNLGNSDESAQHWLVADAATGDLFAAPVHEAHAAVRAQRVAGPDEQPSGPCESDCPGNEEG